MTMFTPRPEYNKEQLEDIIFSLFKHQPLIQIRELHIAMPADAFTILTGVIPEDPNNFDFLYKCAYGRLKITAGSWGRN